MVLPELSRESQHSLLYTSAQRTPSGLSFNEGLSGLPGGPVDKTLPSNAVGVGSIPGQEAKIPYAFQLKIQNKQQKQYCKKLICCCPVSMSCPTPCDPRGCSTPCLPVPHSLLDFAQVCVHGIGDAIQPSHPPLPSSPFAFSLSQHQALFQ